jgi:parallel beta-helix repeat protein
MMKKKMIGSFLFVIIVVSLVVPSCDALLSVAGAVPFSWSFQVIHARSGELDAGWHAGGPLVLNGVETAKAPRKAWPVGQPLSNPDRQGKTIYVDDDNTGGPWDGTLEHPFQHIQDGIQHAEDNDTIYVFAGTYNENLEITKNQLKITGENRETTRLISFASDSAISISAHRIEISGLSITGSIYYGIFLEYADYCNIYNNMIYNMKYGGIAIEYSSHNMVFSNIIYNNCYGITLMMGANYNNVSKNIIHHNQYHGIYVGVSLFTPTPQPHSNQIYENDIFGNNDGVFLFASYNNTIMNNSIENSRTFDGIGLMNAWNNTIVKNVLRNNTRAGLFAFEVYEPSYFNIVKENMFVENCKYGVFFSYYNRYNTIIHNDFINNFENAFDSTNNTWDDGYPSGGNYWSDFDEPSEGAWDNNSDGIVDSSYSILGDGNVDNYPSTTPYSDIDFFRPDVTIISPANGVYVNEFRLLSRLVKRNTFVFGKITILVEAFDSQSGISRVEFYIDEEKMFEETEPPFRWVWVDKTSNEILHSVKVVAVDNVGNYAIDEILVWRFI